MNVKMVDEIMQKECLQTGFAQAPTGAGDRLIGDLPPSVADVLRCLSRTIRLAAFSVLAVNFASESLAAECPAGWICPERPIYSSKIGMWYEPWWEAKGPFRSQWLNTRYKPLL